MARNLSQLSVLELDLFIKISQHGSIREVARQLGLQPPHVSKTIRRLENKLGFRLFKRSVSGVILTPEGKRAVKLATEICKVVEKFEPSSSGEKDRVWSFGAISFLSTYLLAPNAGKFKAAIKKSRFRFVEFTHNELVAHGLGGAFEIALHIEPLEWTRVWTSKKLGKLSWKLYAREGHPLGERCFSAQVIKWPFIVPTDWTSFEYREGEDYCPVSVNQRPKGDEAATAETALEIVRNSDQLTFVPDVMGRRWQGRGIAEIRVSDWPAVTKEIYLSVRSDVVPAKLAETISDLISQELV